MPKLDIEQIKREAIKIFKTKRKALKYIEDFNFKEGERLTLIRKKRKWLIMYRRWY